MNIRTIFIGAVESSAIALDTMISCAMPPLAIVTLPESKASRHSDYIDLYPLAVRTGIPVIETTQINAPETLERLRVYAPDYLLVIGWSQICTPEVLALPSRGVIGYHPAPLPLNRGRAVIPWTILQRQTETGASLFWMDAGVDSGDILVQHHFTLDPDETARTLYDKHLLCLRAMVPEALHHLRDDNAPHMPQDHTRATYCAKRTPADGYITWENSAESIWTMIRATTRPYPGAFTVYHGKPLLLWKAELLSHAPYWGSSGQIQDFWESDAVITCGDGRHLLLREIQYLDGAPCAPQKILKQHDRLGVIPGREWR